MVIDLSIPINEGVTTIETTHMRKEVEYTRAGGSAGDAEMHQEIV